MRKITVSVLVIIHLVGSFVLDARAAQTYHVGVHGSDDNPGSKTEPWHSISYAIENLRSGDTLVVGDGRYEEAASTVRVLHSGSEESPIVVRAERQDKNSPTVQWELDRVDMRPKSVSHWTFEGICFRPARVAFLLGDPKSKVKVSHISFRKCRFEQKQALKIGYADDVLVDGCHFYRIQAEKRGNDMHAISAQHQAHRLTVRDCQFEDISADGVQVGQSASDLRDILIEDCHFWINRNPDGTLADNQLQQQWGNTGENGIDVKQVDSEGSVTIRDCQISGYRPTLGKQNATGAFGAGIVIHFGSHNIVVSGCRLFNNSRGISVGGSRAGAGPPSNVKIENCLIYDNPQVGVHIRDSRSVHLTHNTFVRNGLDNEGRIHAVGIVGGGREQKGAHLWVSRGAHDARIINNLFWRGLAVEGPGDARLALNADYNCWAATDIDSRPFQQGANALVVDKPRVDASSFQPRRGSPLIERAKHSNVNKDYSGHRRNKSATIGAFEFIHFDSTE